MIDRGVDLAEGAQDFLRGQAGSDIRRVAWDRRFRSAPCRPPSTGRSACRPSVSAFRFEPTRAGAAPASAASVADADAPRNRRRETNESRICFSSLFMATLAVREISLADTGCRHECRHGTHECVRYIAFVLSFNTPVEIPAASRSPTANPPILRASPARRPASSQRAAVLARDGCLPSMNSNTVEITRSLVYGAESGGSTGIAGCTRTSRSRSGVSLKTKNRAAGPMSLLQALIVKPDNRAKSSVALALDVVDQFRRECREDRVAPSLPAELDLAFRHAPVFRLERAQPRFATWRRPAPR